MQLRYVPQTDDPHVIGGVDDFDLYLTALGTAVVRWSSAPGARYTTRENPTDPKAWQGLPDITEDQALRIALMFKLFGPEHVEDR